MYIKNFTVIGKTKIHQIGSDIIASDRGLRKISNTERGFKFWFAIALIEAGLIFLEEKYIAKLENRRKIDAN